MTLLEPRATSRPEPGWSWTRTEVPSPEGRRGRRTWALQARSWPGPAAHRRRRDVPVVLVHGLGVASGMSAPLADVLAADGPVLAPDLPGFGRSSKPRPPLDVAELAEVLTTWVRDGVEGRPVLVGTSLGAQVALAAAARFPQEYRGVVLISPTVDEQRRRWSSQLPRWQVEQTTQSMRLRLLQLRDYARAGVPRVIRTFGHALRHRPEEEIRGLEVPALLVHARRDPLLRREWVERLAHRAPEGTLATLPDGVHAACYENPVEVARLVNGFLDRLDDVPDGRAAARGRAA